MLLRHCSGCHLHGRIAGVDRKQCTPLRVSQARMQPSALTQQHLPGRNKSQHQDVRRGSFQVARSSSSTEAVTAELKQLEKERDEAVQAAEVAATSVVKLQEMFDLLEQLALKRVKEGDDDAARELLKEKLSVSALLERTSERAQANYELAARLAQRIGALQQELVTLLGQGLGQGVVAAAGGQGAGSSSSSSSSRAGGSGSTSSSWTSSGSGSSSQSYSRPMAPWEVSLQEARERLAQQERDISDTVAAARFSADSSIAAAKERLRAEAEQSVAEQQARLRQDPGPSRESFDQARERLRRSAAESIEEAQARLRKEDEQMLRYAREVVQRYANRGYARPGEYVTDAELEDVFNGLERRFGRY